LRLRLCLGLETSLGTFPVSIAAAAAAAAAADRVRMGNSQMTDHYVSTETPPEALQALDDEFAVIRFSNAFTSETVCYGYSSQKETTTPIVRIAHPFEVANSSVDRDRPCFVRAIGFAYIVGTSDHVFNNDDGVATVIVRMMYPTVTKIGTLTSGMWHVSESDTAPLSMIDMVIGVSKPATAPPPSPQMRDRHRRLPRDTLVTTADGNVVTLHGLNPRTQQRINLIYSATQDREQ
jgi:hypothetical protein